MAKNDCPDWWRIELVIIAAMASLILKFRVKIGILGVIVLDLRQFIE